MVRLVYILTHVFDPFPYIYDITEKVRRENGIKEVKILGHTLKKGGNPFYQVESLAGPIDFLKLIRDASFIITSSFHGTAFSIIYKIPFISIVNNQKSGDDRQWSLLKKMKMEDRGILLNRDLQRVHLNFEMSYSTKLEELRNHSLDYLKQSLYE